MDIDIAGVEKNLQCNNYGFTLLNTKEAVVPLLKSLLPRGAKVAVGGSTTLFECGVIDYLRQGAFHFLDRHQPGLTQEEREHIFDESKTADVYLCSSNAITRSGTLYNVDGNANRISALVHGPRSVIVVAGINKIVRNLDEAVLRVKTVTAPAICRRSGRNTLCAKTGHCAVTEGGADNMAAGCNSPERTCCHYLVSGRQRVPGRIHVVLVKEDLGA